MTNPILSKRRRLYIAAPFLLLVVCLGSLNVASWLRLQSEVIGGDTATAVPTPTPPANTTPSVLTPTPTPLAATATPVPSPTPYMPPSFAASDMIQPLGPPAGSTFTSESTISFYWQWPLPLSEDQFFAIYLLNGSETILLGTVREANIGNNYRLHVALAELELTAVSLQWQVHLASQLTAEPLRVSEERPLTLLAADP